MAKSRLPFLALGALALWVGLWAGLVRLGWPWPPFAVAAHGPLMVSAFLGTVIGLERAVALAELLKTRWVYAVPLLAGLSGLALMMGAPAEVARVLSILASAGLVSIFVIICRWQWNWPHVTMGVGAGLWLIGNLVWWQTRVVPQATLWWVGFLVLTIAGERLELARVLVLKRVAQSTFLVSAGVLVAGLGLSLVAFQWGVRVSGAGLVAMGLWLLRYDLARRTIRQTGLTRFIAACLLPGYGWLVFAGGLWLARADVFTSGMLYDAMLHAVFLGFVFSMIFGHEPIIVPALLKVAVGYHPVFYAHLLLLHGSLLLRVLGDGLSLPDVRRWGGLLNALALVWFMGNTVWATRRAGRLPK